MRTIYALFAFFIMFAAYKWIVSRYRFGLYYINLLEEALLEQQQERKIVDINDLKPENYDHAMDLRGSPIHMCPCGCNIFNVKVIFDNYEIGTYFLDMECANCGTRATAPTLLDREKME